VSGANLGERESENPEILLAANDSTETTE